MCKSRPLPKTEAHNAVVARPVPLRIDRHPIVDHNEFDINAFLVKHGRDSRVQP
ncbi:hypothetical protein P2F65_04070 [Knoellia sp. p5-6-4]|uniref:hypothetical protein n=1 Tax=Knoellia sp. p5-6-4 TaxID=3032286 RepID=UPI0023DBBE54|nr:hypothetical protein [Knoellia sp. p5-6-4]MDF2144155.1 hypothetical protein [Knoellia sp. p5-6-4]